MAAQSLGTKDYIFDTAKKHCAELRDLPDGWSFKFDDSLRIYFQNAKGETFWENPSLGGLPSPWILKIIRHTKNWEVKYYNKEDERTTSENPRLMEETLATQALAAPAEQRIAASSLRNNNFDLSKLKRQEIKNFDIRSNYVVIHAIDPGDGSKGAMNGGVFVVHMKGVKDKIYIEKRFKEDCVAFGKKEIRILRKLTCASLTAYIDAMIIDTTYPNDASVYIEFCDRGSLRDLIMEYHQRRKQVPTPWIPETWIWHALGCLIDALAFLQTGIAWWANKDPSQRPALGWVPILHRDVKPDNVLLRSRHTQGSTKYFYVVLSDFGVACEEHPPHHVDVDRYHTERTKIGTRAYFAPELCYDPYPIENKYESGGGAEMIRFPNGHRHSVKSDLWATGASVFNLCDYTGAGFSHFDWTKAPPGADPDLKLEATICRKKYLDIPSNYSRQLREAILLVTEWRYSVRLTPYDAIRKVRALFEASGCKEAANLEPLPSWACPRHEYFAKAALVARSNK